MTGPCLGSWEATLSLRAPTRHRYALLLGDVPVASSSDRDELQAYMLLALHCSPQRAKLLDLLMGCAPVLAPSVVDTQEAPHGSA